MRSLPILALTLTLTVPFSHAAIERATIGQSAAELLASAGKPSGRVTSGETAIWIYPEGRAFLADDQVVKLDKVTAAPAAEQDRSEIAQQALRRRVYSPEFLRLPPARQLDYLQHFQIRYPEVDLTSEFDRARDRLERQIEAEQAAELAAKAAPAIEWRPTRRSDSRSVFFSGHARGYRHPPGKGPDTSQPRTTYFSREEQLFGEGAITPIKGVEPIAPQIDPYR